MERYYYSNFIYDFLIEKPATIVGKLAESHDFDIRLSEKHAWFEEIRILQVALKGFEGVIYFEYSIPRMGRRIDVICIIRSVIFVIEFKVGAEHFLPEALDQVMDYALDLKYFHETSHDEYIVPILVSTRVDNSEFSISATNHFDKLFQPIKSNAKSIPIIINSVLKFVNGNDIEASKWERGGYNPTPTIIEAAIALYNGHSVEDISRSDAGAKNLHTTITVINSIIEDSRKNLKKAICFVTGVPGAGKTLVGLNVATMNRDSNHDFYSVFLSGNGPLVDILREALARDKVRAEKELEKKIKKLDVMRQVKSFIQNVHHFRDEYYIESDKKPPEHVVLFDEAQRAWDLEQATDFMRRKRHQPNFNQSEPEFLISCMERHPDWAVIICLVGGGQEIYTGEAGISEWIRSIEKSSTDWQIYISPQLMDSEYRADDELKKIVGKKVHYDGGLHLSVSMRSFRAENVSLLVKQILDMSPDAARDTLMKLGVKYPIVLTRSLINAKKWLKDQARGSERYGIIVSHQAERLKPHAINVKSPIDPIHWFLNGKDDVRSSYYLEDVATEFHIQGLELDWACVTWDADFRYSRNGWQHHEFIGDRWKNIINIKRQGYQKNAYRVLLTRARQGMVIVVPEGDPQDPTRNPEFYNHTFNYLESIGLQVI
jgi:hypothetical protein